MIAISMKQTCDSNQTTCYLINLCEIKINVVQDHDLTTNLIATTLSESVVRWET